MQEKRGASRRPVETYLPMKKSGYKQFIEVGNRETGKVVGHLMDFSLNGVRIMSDKEFSESVLYFLRADFPTSKTESTIVTFDASCVWCKQREDDDLYEAGFLFQKISEEDLAVLRLLLAQHSEKPARP
jgi:hypothetical protein